MWRRDVCSRRSLSGLSAKDTGLGKAAVLLRMAEAARELGDPDWALELYLVACMGTGVTRYMWQDVVRVLTRAGRLDEAARVLQVRGERLEVACVAFLKWWTDLFTSARGSESWLTNVLPGSWPVCEPSRCNVHTRLSALDSALPEVMGVQQFARCPRDQH